MSQVNNTIRREIDPVDQQSSWKAKGQSEEARYIRKKEETQLSAICDEQKSKDQELSSEQTDSSLDRNFEGGFGGQEDLEDRYATTSGEH